MLSRKHSHAFSKKWFVNVSCDVMYLSLNKTDFEKD